MASFRKRGSSWQAMVRANGISKSKSFPTKSAAVAWAAEIERGEPDVSHLTVKDILERYRDTVSPNKDGARWEMIRINLFLRDSDLCNIRLNDLRRKHMAEWRDRRLKQVSGASVIREWAIISRAFKVAVIEWEWMQFNPMDGLDKPEGNPPRDRLPTQDELDRLCHALGYNGQDVPVTITSRVGAAMMFSIETAMRAKEICNLYDTDISGATARINKAKTRAGVRKVPLSKDAIRIIDLLRRVDEPGGSIFHLKTSQLDSIFRKAKKQAMVSGLTFHDMRAEGITRFANIKKVDVLTLARIVGHSDLSKLMVYYRESAESIAERL